MTKWTSTKKKGGQLENIKFNNADEFKKYIDAPFTPEAKTSTPERHSERVSEYTMNKNKNLETEYKKLAKQVALEESEVKDRQKAEREKDMKQMRPYYDELGHQERQRVYNELSKEEKNDQIKQIADSLKQPDLSSSELNKYEAMLNCGSKKQNYFSLFDDKEQKVCRKIQKLKSRSAKKTTQQMPKSTNRSFYSRFFTKRNRGRMGGRRKRKTQRRRNKKY